jgi:uncharacterized membrane protein
MMKTASDLNAVYRTFYDLSLFALCVGAVTFPIARRFVLARVEALNHLPAWVYPVLAGFVLRLLFINQPLWYDEYFTLTIARLFPANTFWQVVFSDVHPPTWYLISAVFDNGQAWLLRLPSLVCGLGIIAVGGVLARRLFDENTSITAMWLLAVLPAQVYYSGEGRVYAALTLAALCAVWAMLADRPRIYVVAAGLLGWLHTVGFIYLAALSLVGLWRWRHRWPHVIGAVMLSSLWLPFMLQQIGDIVDGFWFPAFRVGALPFTLTDMATKLNGPESIWWVIIAVPWGFAVAAWLVRWNGQRAIVAFIALMPPFVVALISAITVNSYLPRAFLPSVSLLIVLLIAPALANRPRWQAAVGTLCIVLIAITPARPDISPTLGAECTQVYYGNVAAAMMGLAVRPDLTPYIRSNPNDLTQTFNKSAQAALGFRYELPRGEFCAFRIINVYTLPAENTHFAALSPLVRQRSGVSFSNFWRVETLYMENGTP